MRWGRKELLLVGAALASAGIAIGIAPVWSATAHAGSTNPEIPVTAPAPPQPPGPLPPIATMEAEDLSTMNGERASAGVGPLQPQAWAAAQAEAQSQAMAAQQTIWHDMSGFMADGHTVLGAIYLGENVAMDSTLAAAEQLLFSDPAHQALILDGRYNYVGVGVALDGRNWVYLTENFAEIPGGAPRPAAPPAAATVKPPAASSAQPARVTAPKTVAAPAPAHPAVVAPAPAAAATPAAPVTTAAPAPVAAAAKAGAKKVTAAGAAHKTRASATGALSTRPVSTTSHLPLWAMSAVMALMSVGFAGAAVVQLRAGALAGARRAGRASVWESPSLTYAMASVVASLLAGRAVGRTTGRRGPHRGPGGGGPGGRADRRGPGAGGRAGRRGRRGNSGDWQPDEYVHSYR